MSFIFFPELKKSMLHRNIHKNATDNGGHPFHPEQKCAVKAWKEGEEDRRPPPSPTASSQAPGQLWLTGIPLASGCTWSRAGRGLGPGHRSPASPHTTRLLTWQTMLVHRERLTGFPPSGCQGPQRLAQLVTGEKINHKIRKQTIQNAGYAAKQAYDLGQHNYCGF